MAYLYITSSVFLSAPSLSSEKMVLALLMSDVSPAAIEFGNTFGKSETAVRAAVTPLIRRLPSDFLMV